MFEFLDSLAFFLGYIVIMASLITFSFTFYFILRFTLNKLKEKQGAKRWKIFEKSKCKERSLVKSDQRLDEKSFKESMDYILEHEKIRKSSK